MPPSSTWVAGATDHIELPMPYRCGPEGNDAVVGSTVMPRRCSALSPELLSCQLAAASVLRQTVPFGSIASPWPAHRWPGWAGCAARARILWLANPCECRAKLRPALSLRYRPPLRLPTSMRDEVLKLPANAILEIESGRSPSDEIPAPCTIQLAQPSVLRYSPRLPPTQTRSASSGSTSMVVGQSSPGSAAQSTSVAPASSLRRTRSGADRYSRSASTELVRSCACEPPTMLACTPVVQLAPPSSLRSKPVRFEPVSR